ncbi:transglycosylase SLT domain-containing protein [Nocardia sp. FBN12]|uniref:transglycosylase SLT domain-containing protein n=1 Tax=Nocardia sp. FBN12 TaxID=3419766 RepID=UPI003CFEA629
MSNVAGHIKITVSPDLRRFRKEVQEEASRLGADKRTLVELYPEVDKARAERAGQEMGSAVEKGRARAAAAARKKALSEGKATSVRHAQGTANEVARVEKVAAAKLKAQRDRADQAMAARRRSRQDSTEAREKTHQETLRRITEKSRARIDQIETEGVARALARLDRLEVDAQDRARRETERNDARLREAARRTAAELRLDRATATERARLDEAESRRTRKTPQPWRHTDRAQDVLRRTDVNNGVARKLGDDWARISNNVDKAGQSLRRLYQDLGDANRRHDQNLDALAAAIADPNGNGRTRNRLGNRAQGSSDQLDALHTAIARAKGVIDSRHAEMKRARELFAIANSNFDSTYMSELRERANNMARSRAGQTQYAEFPAVERSQAMIAKLAERSGVARRVLPGDQEAMAKLTKAAVEQDRAEAAYQQVLSRRDGIYTKLTESAIELEHARLREADTSEIDALNDSYTRLYQTHQSLERQERVAAIRMSSARERFVGAERNIGNRTGVSRVVRAFERVDLHVGDNIREVMSRVILLGRALASITQIATTVTMAMAALGAVRLVPLISSASQALTVFAALPAVLAGAATGIASLVTGMGGIGAAIKAASQAGDQSDEDRTASRRRARDAEQSYERARESADRTYASGQRQIASAEKSVQSALKSSQTAQENLTKARQSAIEKIRGLGDALRGSALDERSAVLAQKRARQNMSDLLKTGNGVTALDIEEAQLAIDQADYNLDTTRKQNRDNHDDAAATRAKGVEGSDEVVAAKEALAEAQSRVEEARSNVTDTIASVAQANSDAQRSIADSWERMTDAWTDLQSSTKDDKLAKAMAKLSPNAQKLVNDILSIKPAWQEVKWAAQDALTNGAGAAVRNFTTAQLPNMKAGFSAINAEIGRGFRDSLSVLSSGKSQADYNKFLTNTRNGFRGLADAAAPLTRTFVDLATAGSSVLPQLGDALAAASARWSEKISLKRETGELNQSINNGIEKMGQLGQIISNTFGGISGVFKAMRGEGDSMIERMTVATAKFEAWAKSAAGASKIQAVFAKINSVATQLSNIISSLGSAVVDVLGPVSENFGITLSVVETLAESLASIVGALMSFGPTAALIEGVATAFVAMYALRSLSGMFDNIRNAASTAYRGMATEATRAQSRLAGPMNALSRNMPFVLTNPVVAAREQFTNLRDTATARLTEIRQAAVDRFPGVASAASSAMDRVQSVANTTRDRVSTVFSRIRDAASGRLPGTRLAAETAFNGIQRAASTTYSSISRGANVMANAMGGWFNVAMIAAVLAITAITKKADEFKAAWQSHQKAITDWKTTGFEFSFDLTKALNNSNGFVDDNVRGLMRQRAQDVMDEWKKAIEDQKNSSQFGEAVETFRFYNPATWFDWTQKLDAPKNFQIDQTGDAATAAMDKLKALKISTGELTSALTGGAAEWDKFKAKLLDGTEGGRIAAEQYQKLRDNFTQTQNSASKLVDALADVRAGYLDAADAADKLTSAMNRQTQNRLTVAEAKAQATQTLTSFNGFTTGESTGSVNVDGKVDVNSQAGAAFHEQLYSLAQAYNSVAGAVYATTYEQTKSDEAARAAVVQATANITDAARAKAGQYFSGADLDNVLGEYGIAPDSFTRAQAPRTQSPGQVVPGPTAPVTAAPATVPADSSAPTKAIPGVLGMMLPGAPSVAAPAAAAPAPAAAATSSAAVTVPDYTGAIKAYDDYAKAVEAGYRDRIVPSFDGALDKATKLSTALVDGIGAAKPKLDEFVAAITNLHAVFKADITEGALVEWAKLRPAMDADLVVLVDYGLPNLVRGLDELNAKFKSVATDSTASFAGIKKAVAEPINWLITNVFNTALKNAWNEVRKTLPSLPEWTAVIPTISGYHRGGIIPGYQPGVDDRIVAVGRGEAIMRPEFVRAFGSDWVHQMNAAARSGGVSAVQRIQGAYAGGGIVDSMESAVKERWPSMQLTSGLRFTDNGYHSTGQAADFSDGSDSTPTMRQLAAWFASNFQSSTLELIHSPFNHNLKNGRDVGDGMGFYGPATMAEHRNHVHVALAKALGDMSNVVMPALGGNMFGAAGARVQELLTGPMAALAKQVPTGASNLEKLPRAIFDAVTGAATAAAGSSVDAGNVAFDISAGAAQWRDNVIAALLREGFEANERNINLTLAQIQSESGGDPNIVQQVQDVNSGGNEGVGLLQVIPGTFARWRNPALPNDRTDPDANISAALRYYRAKWGEDLGAMWGQAHGYDQGGWLEHGSIGYNLSGKPEPVFTNDQWVTMSGLLKSLSKLAPGMTALTAPSGPAQFVEQFTKVVEAVVSRIKSLTAKESGSGESDSTTAGADSSTSGTDTTDSGDTAATDGSGTGTDTSSLTDGSTETGDLSAVEGGDTQPKDTTETDPYLTAAMEIRKPEYYANKWKDIPSNFAETTWNQFTSDLGITGEGTLSQLVKLHKNEDKNIGVEYIQKKATEAFTGAQKTVEQHVHYHVTNIDEALRKNAIRQRQDASGFMR